MSDTTLAEKFSQLFEVPPVETKAMPTLKVFSDEKDAKPRETIQLAFTLNTDSPQEGVALIEDTLRQIPALNAAPQRTLEQAVTRLIEEFNVGDKTLTPEEVTALQEWHKAPEVHVMSNSERATAIVFGFSDGQAAQDVAAVRTNIESRLTDIRDDIIAKSSELVTNDPALNDQEKQEKIERLKELHVEVIERKHDDDRSSIALKVGEFDTSKKPDNDGVPALTVSPVFNEIMQDTPQGAELLREAVATAGDKDWLKGVAFSDGEIKSTYLASRSKDFEKDNPVLARALQELATHTDLQEKTEKAEKASIMVKSPNLDTPEFRAEIILPESMTSKEFIASIPTLKESRQPSEQKPEAENNIVHRPKSPSFTQRRDEEKATPKTMAKTV